MFPDQVVITPPVSATPTIHRSLPFPSTYAPRASTPNQYNYPPGYPGSSDYYSRPLPPHPYYQLTIPPPVSQRYPASSLTPYRSPLPRNPSLVSLDTFAPRISRHPSPSSAYADRHPRRGHRSDVEGENSSSGERYRSGDERIDSEGRRHHRQSRRKKRERKDRHRRREERGDREYYDPDLEYDGYP
jgi:hypothetical protein